MNPAEGHVVGRGVVYCRHGGSASAQPLATTAALQILMKGGSFIDASIACSAVLAVIEPAASGLGGDCFIITHHVASKENLAFNGSGESPHGATLNSPELKEGIPFHGFLAAAVPGLVSTWFEAHERYGKLPVKECLAQAIDYATNGFPAYPRFIKRMKLHMKNYPNSELFSHMGISTDLTLGDLVIQSDLGETLKAIAAGGRDAFYKGVIAEKIIASTNGWFNTEDLSNHKTRVEPPLTVKYRDLNVYGQPPPTQGIILMEELLLATEYDVKSLSEADRIHMMVESKKLAFEDRFKMLGDPEKVPVNCSEILNKEHCDKRRLEIDMMVANNKNVDDPEEGADTTYFIVVDSEGNAASWIQSVFHPFGSSWVAEGTGIIFNNRLTGFSMDKKSPNCLAPFTRPAHTLNAWVVTTPEGKLKYVGGTPGANIQVQSNFQLIIALVDLGMNVQEACEYPRWQHLSDRGESGGDEQTHGTLFMESRFSQSDIGELRMRGHNVKGLGHWGHGSAVQLCEILPNGTYAFGSDPRASGHAMGY
eukprot:CAMPEP_0119052634 /NCGR_PEP_ID=MMETSP1177-20130426/73866_1 /TAXON_ID=2985 /ORGANISM="Ochromonas sp, Strain CCMP1899" /LENGTH=535 /DNA_ID=CAMNT_0007032271 /DNA_START=306 /DNA_END=1913 /DNA_ORIENTATION=-